MSETLKQHINALFSRRKWPAVVPANASKDSGKTSTRILIISNCQVQVLKHGLSSLCVDAIIDTIPVHVLSSEARHGAIARSVAQKANYDFVLTIPLSDEFGALASDRIVESFAPTPVISITNINFNGTHPDICYIGGMNARTPGPLGDYHSQIALFAYLEGVPENQATGLYCDAVYRQLEYYDAFHASLSELTRRDTNTDIPIGGLLENMVRKGVCFMSNNHPTPMLMAAYINTIARELSRRGLIRHAGFDIDGETMINYLAYAPVFPIYPEVATHHGLPFSGSYLFRTATVGEEPGRALTLEDFLRGEYQAFRDADQKTLRETWPGVMLSLKHQANADLMSFFKRRVEAASK